MFLLSKYRENAFSVLTLFLSIECYLLYQFKNDRTLLSDKKDYSLHPNVTLLFIEIIPCINVQIFIFLTGAMVIHTCILTLLCEELTSYMCDSVCPAASHSPMTWHCLALWLTTDLSLPLCHLLCAEIGCIALLLTCRNLKYQGQMLSALGFFSIRCWYSFKKVLFR